MNFPRYSEYKESGIAGVGLMPIHWHQRRVKEFLREHDERSIDGAETLLSVSAYTGVSPRAEIINDGEHLSRAESLDGYKKCEPNDLVVNIMLAWNRGLGVSLYSGIVSPSYAVFRITDASDPKYLDYLLRSDECIGLFKMHSTGVIDSRLRLYPDVFAQLKLALPARAEQSAIAESLDRETAKIDALVAEQEKLIALLKEKRQALISHVVTKGLDPGVSMKDSGIEWLGQVPAHWDVGGLTRFIGPVVDYRGRTPEKVDEGMFLVTAKNIRNGRIDYGASEEYVTFQSAQSLLNRGAPQIGDVLFTTEAPLGQVALVDRTDFALAQRVVKFRGKDGVLQNAFLLFWLMGSYCQAQLETLATGSTALGIKASKLGMIDCVIPPVTEQGDIVDFLNTELKKYDLLIVEAEQSIGLLKERRSALISATVTGKIDVREFVTR